MRRRKRELVWAALLTASATGISGHATAQDSGFFVGASAAGLWVAEIEGGFVSGEPERSAQPSLGYGGSVHLGYDFGAFQIGVDGGYRRMGIDSVSGGSSVDGDVDVFSAFAMVGAEYDNERFDPFIRFGGGVLVGSADVSFIDTRDNNALVDEEETVTAPAIVIQAGIAYNMTENLDVIARYEFVRSVGATLEGDGPNFSDIDEDVEAHAILVGLQYQF